METFKKYLICFLKGLLAGLSIGLGGFLYVLMTFIFKDDSVVELGKIFGSILFAVGLFLVCTFYLNLYTGKIGLIFEEKKDKSFYISLPVMLIANLLGAFLLGFVCYLIFKDTDLFLFASKAAESRLVLDSVNNYLSTIIKSCLCGLCVYLAVKCFARDRLHLKGILLLVLFVFIFVYCGFQHCIANMFYFGFAFTFRIETLINLLIVITCNSIGPIPGVILFKLFKAK